MKKLTTLAFCVILFPLSAQKIDFDKKFKEAGIELLRRQSPWQIMYVPCEPETLFTSLVMDPPKRMGVILPASLVRT